MIHAVSSEPKAVLSRLRRMSWKEAHVRLGQEMWKRLDLASYRAGISAPPRVLESKHGITGEFFFSAAELPDRVKCLSGALPEEAKAIVREADEICRHDFHLLGYQNLDYGSVIDWHLDAVSGKRTPLEPWFKIHFLRYEEAGDHKVIWELNRHQHLVTLAKAWCLTGNKKYLDEITTQWFSWQQANPYPLGINWASSLEVAFRSLSWLWVLSLLANCSQLPPSFPTQVVSALALNGRHIEHYLSTYFSPNTHLLGEAVALFFIGVLCPQLPAATRWKNKGWQILLQEADRQVRADGVYFEQSLYYHVYALDFFLHARILAARNGVDIPQAFDEKIHKMLDVLHVLGQAGPTEAFGDDDGGRVFNPRRNRAENLADPLAIGAVLYGFRFATLTEEAIWLFGEQAVRAQGQPRPRLELRSRAFQDAGVYVMADDAANMQLIIDAGPQGTGRCGHGHADALSILLSGGERRWLVDSGTFRYISNSDARTTFRGTGAHNSLRVDGLDQAVPEGPFAWSETPQVKADRWVVGDAFDFFDGSHDGYGRLPHPVTHRRFVFLLKGKFWLVRDVAEGTGRHELEIFWHFASDLRLRNEHNAFIAESLAGVKAASSDLVLQTCPDATWATSLDTALISPAYGAAFSAPVVTQRASTPLPADSAALLIPQARNAALGKLSAIQHGVASGVRAYRYQANPGDHYFFFAETGSPWECGPWSSDANFLYGCLEDGRLVHLILVAGGFCKWHDTALVTLNRRIERFEWLQRDGKVATSSSDDNAVLHSLAHELACSDPVI